MAFDNNNLFKGKGRLYLHRRDTNGDKLGGWWVGNATVTALEQSEEVEEVVESYSGNNNLIARIGDRVINKLKIAFHDIKQKNLLVALRATALSIGSGSYTSGSPDTLETVAVGDYVTLAKPNVSSLVIKDSTGSPVTLTLDTHYEVVDADFGRIKILDLTGLTQPLKAEYSYGATTGVTIQTDEAEEYWVELDGLNITTKPHKKVQASFYRVSFSPSALMSLINTEVNVFELEGSVLLDEARDDNSAFGGYGRILYIDALS